MKSKIKLYLDSDGVLFDWDARVIEILEGKQVHQVPKGKVWASIQRYNDTVQQFYKTLPLMDRAHVLVEFAQEYFEEVHVLTAAGFTPKDVKQQKIDCFAEHFPSLHVICVDKSPDKALYASPTSILVDDRLKSIEPWVAGGGIGIMHTSIDDTIRQLMQYID